MRKVILSKRLPVFAVCFFLALSFLSGGERGSDVFAQDLPQGGKTSSEKTAGGTGNLPKTGQTKVFYNGDDASYQAGYQGERFADNGNGTVTDNATALTWVKDGAGPGCNNGNTLTWKEAIDFAENLDFAGYSDWRLPNVKELQSIVDYGSSAPAISPLFSGTRSYYWTSTTFLPVPDFAFFVEFKTGGVYREAKSSTAYLRPVRGGR